MVPHSVAKAVVIATCASFLTVQLCSTCANHSSDVHPRACEHFLSLVPGEAVDFVPRDGEWVMCWKSLNRRIVGRKFFYHLASSCQTHVYLSCSHVVLVVAHLNDM
jgi:hypothetical protein